MNAISESIKQLSTINVNIEYLRRKIKQLENSTRYEVNIIIESEPFTCRDLAEEIKLDNQLYYDFEKHLLKQLIRDELKIKEQQFEDTLNQINSLYKGE